MNIVVAIAFKLAINTFFKSVFFQVDRLTFITCQTNTQQSSTFKRGILHGKIFIDSSINNFALPRTWQLILLHFTLHTRLSPVLMDKKNQPKPTRTSNRITWTPGSPRRSARWPQFRRPPPAVACSQQSTSGPGSWTRTLQTNVQL